MLLLKYVFPSWVLNQLFYSPIYSLILLFKLGMMNSCKHLHDVHPLLLPLLLPPLLYTWFLQSELSFRHLTGEVNSHNDTTPMHYGIARGHRQKNITFLFLNRVCHWKGHLCRILLTSKEKRKKCMSVTKCGKKICNFFLHLPRDTIKVKYQTESNQGITWH